MKVPFLQRRSRFLDVIFVFFCSVVVSIPVVYSHLKMALSSQKNVWHVRLRSTSPVYDLFLVPSVGNGRVNHRFSNPQSSAKMRIYKDIFTGKNPAKPPTFALVPVNYVNVANFLRYNRPNLASDNLSRRYLRVTPEVAPLFSASLSKFSELHHKARKLLPPVTSFGAEFWG